MVYDENSISSKRSVNNHERGRKMNVEKTFAGTHNSAAYNLTYDCDSLADACKLKYASNSCNEQYETCKNNRTASCDIQANVFKNWNPTFFQWTGDLFNSICKTSDILCVAWRTVCKGSGNACELLRDACKKDFSNRVLECLWENNQGYPIKQQLEDVGNGSVVSCHGERLRRALGTNLDSIFLDIKKFMEDNPNEILNIAFGDYDGLNGTFVANYIQDKLEYYFVNGSGYSLMLQEKRGWPKLNKMIEINQRIVIWFGRLYYWLWLNNTRKDWVHSINTHFTVSYTYTAGDLTAQQLNESFNGWSNNSQNVIADDLKNYGYIRWQTIDVT
ncbi:7820_t:CDS:2 [Diversispora eburnea]|uniref:7820_t:CDS:1 n=1 Tax=Diversispora eburnea TaxID=1213867 RepID=A0A9N8ZFU0_9GLOM|nr:7820_t:CDS:2 [Diversispora eburnea]